MVGPINSAYDLPTYDNILNQHDFRECFMIHCSHYLYVEKFLFDASFESKNWKFVQLTFSHAIKSRQNQIHDRNVKCNCN